MFSTMKCLLPLALGLAVAGAGCSSTDDTALPTAPTIQPATMSETFTGTVFAQSSDAHNFIVSATSSVAVTLTSVTPDVPVGLGIGIPSGVSCALSLGERAQVTAQASTTALLKGTVVPGTFCVLVYDAGGIVDPVEYTLTVNHG